MRDTITLLNFDRAYLGFRRRAERGGPKLNWSDIQPCLGNAAGDVLLLLDCCCAIQAAREQSKDRIIPGNVEMLAASAMGNEKTPPPGEYSFTSKLIKELEGHLHSNKYARVSELHKNMLQEDRKLIETPIHTSFAARSGSIRLAQLQSLAGSKRKLRDVGSLTLELPLLVDPTEKILDEIAEWLRDRPPHAISLLENKLKHLDENEACEIFLTSSRDDANRNRRQLLADLDSALADYGTLT